MRTLTEIQGLLDAFPIAGARYGHQVQHLSKLESFWLHAKHTVQIGDEDGTRSTDAQEGEKIWRDIVRFREPCAQVDGRNGTMCRQLAEGSPVSERTRVSVRREDARHMFEAFKGAGIYLRDHHNRS